LKEYVSAIFRIEGSAMKEIIVKVSSKLKKIQLFITTDVEPQILPI
jgi:hypothetical protein